MQFASFFLFLFILSDDDSHPKTMTLMKKHTLLNERDGQLARSIIIKKSLETVRNFFLFS